MIGFDAKRAFANYSGLGNYSRFVIDALSGNFPNERFRLYAPRITEHPGMRGILSRPNVSAVSPNGVYRAFSSLWRSWGMTATLAAEGVSLFHGLSNELPAGLKKKGIASVVTVHDVIFLRFPELYKAPDRAVYGCKSRHACAAADHIIAVSECTKRDIVSFLGVSPEKISVVYQSCDPAFALRFSEEQKKAVATAYSLPKRYVLSVGTVEARKNLLAAAKALPFLDANVHLVAVGRETAYAEKVRQWAQDNGLKDRVHILSGVPFSDLPAIYQSASAFAYPSFFEGFGIPVLEALYSGVPVVAATGSSLEEAGGPGSVYVDPHNHEALADALRHILSDDGVKDRMVTEGLSYTAAFDRRVLAAQLMACYETVLRGAAPGV